MNRLRQLAACLLRLHPFTWCVVVLLAVALLLIAVPGEKMFARGTFINWPESAQQDFDWLVGDDPYELYEQNDELFIHGWPVPWMVRGIDHRSSLAATVAYNPAPVSADLAPSWSAAECWPLRGEWVHWNLWCALLNVAAVLLLLTLVGYGTEKWIRWRGGLFRFRMIECLAGLALFSVALTWHQYHVRLGRFEQQVDEQCSGEGCWVECHSSYVGPRWLTKLGGIQAQPSFLVHAETCSLLHVAASVQPDEAWRHCLESMSKLDYLQSISIGQFMTLGDANLPDWQVLISEQGTRISIPELRVMGYSFRLKEIQSLLKLIDCQTLSLNNVYLTEKELAMLRTENPNLEIIAQWKDFHSRPPRSYAEIEDALNDTSQNPFGF